MLLLVQFVLVVLDTILPVGTDQPYLLHTDVDIPCPLVSTEPDSVFAVVTTYPGH